MRRSLLGAMLAIGATSVACTGVGPLGTNGVELTLTADNSILTIIGEQTQVELELPDGMTTTDLEAVWSTNAPQIASVDANGLVTAVGQGLATITARVGAMSASTTITVDANIVGVAQVLSGQTDPNAANNSATVTITVHAD
jgi:hypothetical protein